MVYPTSESSSFNNKLQSSDDLHVKRECKGAVKEDQRPFEGCFGVLGWLDETCQLGHRTISIVLGPFLGHIKEF